MTWRGKLLVFVGALLLANLFLMSVASASTDRVTVIKLTSKTVESQFVDVAPTGGAPTLGDQFVFSDNLFAGGTKVGIDGGACTAVRVQHAPAVFQCQVTARLHDGDLTAQGFATQQATNTYAITGGTGRWRNAGGQAVVVSVSETVSKITIYATNLGD